MRNSRKRRKLSEKKKRVTELNTKIKIIQADKAREFTKLFEEACSKLKIPHYFSRVKTSK